MSIYLVILISVSLVALVWNAAVLPWLQMRGVNPNLLGIVTGIVEEAVAFAEQMYKLDKDTDRKALAAYKVAELLLEMNIDPDPWEDAINWLIEAAVNRLPKTNQ